MSSNHEDSMAEATSSAVEDKVFISAEALQRDSFLLARRIIDSGFKPNYIVGVWRGGTPVGITVQELLEYRGIKSDHISIRTSSYDGMKRRPGSVQVHGLGYIIDKINAEDSLLIVDDVFDSGLSVQAICEELEKRARKNTPHDVRVATVYYKPGKRKVDRVPDYYIHETDKWLVFPHEIHGLSEAEIRQYKPAALGIEG
ncbi:MAG: phosphoribosyltransferase [Pseudomonadota bacterium]